MKRTALVFIGLIVSLLFVGGVTASTNQKTSKGVFVKFIKVTADQARTIALKKIDGKVEEEYTLEDDEGETTTFIFMIKQKDGKLFEVQVDAGDGKVISAEEQEVDDSEDEDPPSF